MLTPMEYFIPESDVLFEEEIKKSRFLTYLRHTENMEQAKAFWQEMKALHPHARHWCWATVAGPQPIRNNMGFLTMASQQAPQVNPCSIIYWVQV